jgi:hypothetical protein
MCVIFLKHQLVDSMVKLVYGIQQQFESLLKNMFFRLLRLHLPMKYRLFKCLIMPFTIFTSVGCTTTHFVISFKPKTEFKNTGEQENYWAQELFERDYKTEHYKKYKAFTSANENCYQFNKVVITAGNDALLKALLDTGLFYPGVMSKAYGYQPKIHIKINKDSLKVWTERYNPRVKEGKTHPFPKIDSLTITDLKEMKFLEKTAKRRRFQFWMFTKGFANPIVYFMELTNPHATSATDMITFVNGAKLTFFDEGWVII